VPGYYAGFSHQAQSWRTCGGQGRAAFERLRPRVGFVVTNLARPAEGSVAFYNQRGRQIKEGKRRD
jgi:hypothetical protein